MKLNWGHGIAIAMGIFMIFIVTLVLVGGAQDVGHVIREDYYEYGSDYQKVIESQSRANKMQNKPSVAETEKGFLISFPEDAYPIDKGEIVLLRNESETDDVQLPLILNNNGEMIISGERLKKGIYESTMTWIKNGEEYEIKESKTWKMPQH